MSLWTQKYTPKSSAEICGQGSSVSVLKNFIIDFKKQKKRALLLYGPSGCGKSCAVYALAKELNYEVLEVNASDFRDEESLTKSVGEASKQQSLFAKSKILLIDEVDGIFGRQDQGAVPTLAKLAKTTAFPIIMTANDPWDKKFAALRTACILLEFKHIDHQTILNHLRHICESEHISSEEKALASLARRAGGDVRAAIIDLQSLIENNALSFDRIELLSSRRQTDTMFNALMRILKTTDAFVARTSLEDVEEDLNETMLWIDENLPKEYTKAADISRAYEKLSHADVFNGRIIRRQHWHFLATISVLLSAGVALSKDQKYPSFIRYSPPQRLLKIWRSKQSMGPRTSIVEKIARKTHCSKSKTLQTTLPSMKLMLKKDPESIKKIQLYLDLNSDECDWLLGKN